MPVEHFLVICNTGSGDIDTSKVVKADADSYIVADQVCFSHCDSCE